MNRNIEWTPINKKKVHSTKIFDIEDIVSISPKGEKKTFVILNSPEWAITVPVLSKNNKNYFVMVRQWRHGASCILQEFPGGVVDKDESPIQAAKRELLEETGYRTKHIEFLGSLFPNPAIMQNHCHIFFAECDEVSINQNTDNDEFIDVILTPCDEIIKNMGTPPFQHALMSSALFLYLQKHTIDKTIFSNG